LNILQKSNIIKIIEIKEIWTKLEIFALLHI
jgi:hypothetical protein